MRQSILHLRTPEQGAGSYICLRAAARHIAAQGSAFKRLREEVHQFEGIAPRNLALWTNAEAIKGPSWIPGQKCTPKSTWCGETYEVKKKNKRGLSSTTNTTRPHKHLYAAREGMHHLDGNKGSNLSSPQLYSGGFASRTPGIYHSLLQKPSHGSWAMPSRLEPWTT